MRLHLSPVTAAGTALHFAGELVPRLPLDSLRPYIGLVGVLLGSAMGTLGSRVTTFGLADLRGGLLGRIRRGRLDHDELRRRPDADRRRLALSRRGVRRAPRAAARHRAVLHHEPARAAVAEPSGLSGDAVSRRRRLGHVHSADHQLHPAQSAVPAHRLRHRHLCDEFRTVAERRGLARRMVLGPLVLALDRLAVLRRVAGDVRLRLVSACPREKPNLALCSRARLARPRLRRARFLLCSMPASIRATASTGCATAPSTDC